MNTLSAVRQATKNSGAVWSRKRGPRGTSEKARRPVGRAPRLTRQSVWVSFIRGAAREQLFASAGFTPKAFRGGASLPICGEALGAICARCGAARGKSPRVVTAESPAFQCPPSHPGRFTPAGRSKAISRRIQSIHHPESQTHSYSWRKRASRPM